MVERKKRIAKKPSSPPPEADRWIHQGGSDPEIQSAPVAPAAPEEKKKPYPHRISFDTTKEQYRRLKRACFEEERSLNDAIREAVEEWLQARNY